MATPLPPLASAVRLRMTHTIGDDITVENVMYGSYAVSAPLTAVQVGAIATLAYSEWVSQVLFNVTNSIELTSVTCTDLDTLTAFEETATGTSTGHSTNPAVPAGVAGVVRLTTALRGRSYRGRLYLAGCDRTFQTSPQLWTTGYATSLGGGVTNFITGMLAGGGGAPPITMGIASFYSGTDATIPGKRPVPIRRVTPLITPITAATGIQRIGSQRRRNH